MLGRNPPPLSAAEIAAALSDLPGWVREGDTLCKTYQLPTYAAGLIWATTIGTLAEGLDHHPDMLIGWKQVTVRFTTHSVGHKITINDVQAARSIEALAFAQRLAAG
jgi:4a-hydroxytetrahydrobiopterin dehydratase